MENFEAARFEISKFDMTSNSLIDTLEGDLLITFINNPHHMILTREETLKRMRAGDGFYYKERKLLIEKIESTPYLHIEKNQIPRDILE